MMTITQRIASYAITAIMAGMVSGCLEYETTTTVHPNGSFTRSLVVRGDSAALTDWRFKIPADSTWTVRSMTQIEDEKWQLEADRVFGSAEIWDSWRNGLDRRVLDCSIRVEEEFRFFTTRYVYTETIRSYNPFPLIPITDYISPSELDMFFRVEVLQEGYPSKGDSLALDDASDRFEEWEVRTRVESIFEALRESSDEASGLDSTRWAELKESLVERLLGDEADDSYSLDGLRSWARSTREKAVVSAFEAATEELAQIKKDVQFVHDVGSDSYTSKVSLPGEIVRSNGIQDGTSSVSWDNYIAYAYVADFTMEAESSVVNIWAIVLTLGMIVGFPILVWVARRTRNRQR